MENSQSNRKLGLCLIILAFSIWGLIPLYFKTLIEVSPLEILAHRAVWSLFFLIGILLIQKQFMQIFECLKNKKYRYYLILTAILISSNWLIYIWAILHNYLMEASLGYFLTPLLNILLGVLFLKENLNFMQKISLSITIVALFVQFSSAQFFGVGPWISMSLALTFGIYSLIRKKIEVNSEIGLSIETLYLFPFAFGYLVYIYLNQNMVFLSSVNTSLILIFSGVVTALPLLLFVAGSKYLPLSSVGFFQYISPTSQLLIAIFVYNEKASVEKIISFSLVWFALSLYIIHNVYQIYFNKKIQIKS
ncbi:EamA family transporter RarD [Fluviispira sanaruensis]|uniref:EamA family transporter RarD n=1 Tax=Fluviispira sanaruensis TaxID=2493639 RepID=A0A4P2VME5_FLUSA|nr:EamA family transporter RarD [Fluviispira sanaruensis]BBH53928.1 EamA family transporter RarD [Fluviispira sanaruensis]